MRKRILSILLTVCLVLSLMPSVSLTVEAASSVWNGNCDSSLTETARDGSTGTGYYLIDSAEKLAQVAYLSNNGNDFSGKTVLLTDDIILNSGDAAAWGDSAPSNGWTPIGNYNYNQGAKEFYGTFDGQGHTISGLYLKDDLNIRGLFGYIGAGGVICNVGLVNSYLEGRAIVGGFTGYNEGIISNCWNTATVTTVATPIQHASYSMFGGIAGGNGGTIQNCYNLGTVSNNGNPNAANFGGIAGSNRSATSAGTVTNCYNAGTISGASSVGGIAGDTGTAYSTIQYSYSLSDSGIGTGSAKIIGCGTFAGSAATDYITLVQDSAAGYTYTYTNDANSDGTTTTPLLSALNAWVNTTASTNLCSWKTEGGYPVFGSFGVSTYGAFSVTYDYSSTAPTYASNTMTLGSGDYTVAMAEGVTKTTTDKIVVSSGAAANITLNNVNIDMSGNDWTNAFWIGDNATVYLTLKGTNTLKSGIGQAGLRVTEGSTLTITEQSTGSLQAASKDSNGHYPGAGIGGDKFEDGGDVTINGGTVTAIGGADQGRGAAGIGGSCDANGAGSGGTVTITGGTVIAKGGARAAGIGGGSNGKSGTGGTVVITGGTVIAIGGSLGGAGIGGGSGGAADVVINGGSVKAVAGSSGVPAIGTSATGVYQGTLKNASGTNVALYTFTLSGISSETAVTAVDFLPALGYSYGTTDMKTDADGMLYLYLPAGVTGANVTAAAAKTYKNESFTGNAATLYYGYPVTGTVNTGTTGVGVSGLTVNLYSSTDTTFSASVGSSTTDGSGAYTINLPNGSYVARVAGVAGSYAASVSETITVNDGPVSGADITLKALTTQSLAVKAGSHKTAYIVGEPLDVTNLKITVTRNDGSTYDKNVTADMVSGFDSSSIAESQSLIITFDGLTTNYTISISRAAYSGSVAPAPTLINRTDTQVTLGTVTVDGQTVEYGKKNSNATPTQWQDGTTFTGLTAGSTYYFFARVKQTAAVEAGGVSTALTVTTLPATPAASVVNVNYADETLSFANTYEVSTSAGFTTTIASGDTLQPGSTYYVRIKSASGVPASEAVSFTVSARPMAPSAASYSYDYEDEQILFDATYEVYTATSAGIAVTSDSTVITPGSTLYIRAKATSSTLASDWTTITVPARLATTGLSITANRTDTTITVAAITGAEYSKDGGTTWQSSNVFTGLNPNTDYDINIRYAATTSNFASTPLGSVTLRTKTSSGDAPSAPSVSTQTDNAITINTVSGCQYAITTSDTEPTTWEAAETTSGTKAFSSLSAATQYYIWVRTAENDTTMPSEASRISVYTAAAIPSGDVYTIDYNAETISYDSMYEITADKSASPLTIIGTGDSITSNISDYNMAAKKIYVRVKAVTNGAPAGAWMEATIPTRPETPSASALNETVSNKNDGKISGVTESMEWKAAGGTYTPVTANQALNGITGLADGTYYLRHMAVNGTGFKSGEQEITITAGQPITVTFNSTSGSAIGTITGKAYGDSITAPEKPSRSGFYFAGWYKEAACANPWTFDLDTLTDNITLYAKWSAIPTYTVTGKIVDDTSHAVEGATVRMMQGTTQFGTMGVADTNGDFTINNVPPGIYNLVITKGTKTAIVKVQVSSGNVAIGNATLPSGNANSILVVNGSDTPNVVVGELDSEANAQLANSSNPHADIVDITLTVEKKDASTATNGSEVTSAITAAGKQVGMILAIDVKKTVNGTEDNSYRQTNGLIEINIPLPVELQGKASYEIYRYHGTSVDTITETPNADLEKIVVDRTNWAMTLYAKKFSTYAIGYTNPASDGGGGISPHSGTSSSSSSRSSSKTNPSLSPSPSGKGTVDLPYYVENGKDIMVGFASNASGTMKYIAPKSVKVLFRENPKQFNDITGHWAKDNIDFVTQRELFLGTENGNFSPQSGMTRAMFATVIGRLYERSYGEITPKEDHTFTDVDKGAYYATYIDWASENNIITGIGSGLFKPDQQITRQEMAAILYRFAEYLNFLPAGSKTTQLNYPDATQISSWAAEGAMYCQQTQIITGRLGGNFVPQGTATRAEVAAILQRFIENSVK